MLTIFVPLSLNRPSGLMRLLVATLLILGGFVADARAQTTGDILGQVLGDDEVEIPGATVSLTSSSLIGGKKETTTDDSGRFRFVQLLPGLYDVTVSKAKFRTVTVTGIQVIANRQVIQNVTLPFGESEEVVDVVATKTVDVTSTTQGQVLTKALLQRLPTGRSYQQAVQLVSGVTGGSNPNVSGAASNENAFMIDGLNVTDPVTGTFANNFNYDAIQQIEVLLGGYDAEFNTIGGLINVVTDSGSNNLQFDTSVFYGNGDLRPRKDVRLTADGYQLGPDGFASSFQTLQVSARVSGPLVRDKAFFIFSYQHERSLIANTSMPQRRDYDGHYVLGKLTIQPNNAHRVSLLFQTDPSAIDNIVQNNPFTRAEAQGRQSQGGFSAQARWQWFLTEKVNLDTRVSAQKTTIEVNSVPCTHNRKFDRHQCKPGEQEGDVDYWTPGRIGLSGAFDSVNWGQLYLDDRFRFIAGTKLAVVGVEDPLKGQHDFKFGVEGNQFLNNYFSGFSGNTYYYDIYTTPFDPQTFTNYYSIEYSSPIFQRNTGSTWNFFAQDAYKPVSNLTIRYGFRVDSTNLRNDIGDSVVRSTLWSPRLYAAWDPFKDQKTKIGGGYGRFTDPGRQSVSDLTSASNFGLKLYFGEYFARQFGLSPVSSAATMADANSRRNLNTANPRLRLPTTDEFSVFFERQLVQDVRFGVNAVARFTRHLYDYDENNLIYDEDGSSIIGSRRDDPLNSYFRIRTPREARRNYYKVEVNLTKLESKRWAGNISYAFQWLNGTQGSSLEGSFSNDQQLAYSYGPLATVGNHALKAYGYWLLPNDPWTTTIGFFFNYESGQTLERLYYDDAAGGYGLRIRNRNYYTTFNDFWSLDAQIQQDIDVRKGKLTIQAIIENLTNNQAPAGLSGLLYSQNRLLATSLQSPLRWTLGLRYSF